MFFNLSKENLSRFSNLFFEASFATAAHAMVVTQEPHQLLSSVLLALVGALLDLLANRKVDH